MKSIYLSLVATVSSAAQLHYRIIIRGQECFHDQSWRVALALLTSISNESYQLPTFSRLALFEMAALLAGISIDLVTVDRSD